MKRKIFRIGRGVILAYAIIFGVVWLFQEKMIFFPQRLAPDYVYHFSGNYHEVSIPTPDGINLNALFFKARESKGVILYFHGNAGSLAGWGLVGQTYTDLGYDVLIADYRGFGKSGGTIKSQSQLFNDAQLLYDNLKKQYDEKNIVILGYSIGTGIAAHLAAENNPKLLILQAPYTSLAALVRSIYSPLVPTFLLKYTLDNDKYIKLVSAPIVIFHGTRDEVVPYKMGEALKRVLKPTDRFIPLVGQGHLGITDNVEYRQALNGILTR